MPHHYKNSYKVTEKELVSLSVYNVGFQKCDALYQWGPGIRDHYLIHYIISGKGTYRVAGQTYHLSGGDTFLVYPNTEVVYCADEQNPWEYAWVGFTGSDASMILKATDFSPENPFIPVSYTHLTLPRIRARGGDDRTSLYHARPVHARCYARRQPEFREQLCTKKH